jgi:glycerol-3-phosphate dehydrogenase
VDRNEMIRSLEAREGYWDIIVVGGGATGLGVALDSASRGYKTLLLEQHDFSKGTSSRSTKLIHGGVRYLRQGNVSLVIEALHERGLMLQNAPHLVSHQSFIVPNYEWWDGPFYGAGMKVYDLLAGKLGLGPSKWLSREETLARIPTLESEGLRGGVIYYDGQFDDARLAVNLAQTVVDHGGVVLNYMRVTDFIKSGSMIQGVVAVDEESGRPCEINGRAVINATGVFADDLLMRDNPGARRLITPSQGVHLILDKSFLPGDSAVMVPQTADGRVLFAVPWHGRVVVGTTDTPVEEVSLEPRALESEIDFILGHAAQYLRKDPTRLDVKSVFAGLRPLVDPGHSKSTAAISRDHYLVVSESGLVTITGGKWTTYRKMAEATINQALMVAGLPDRVCATRNLRIHAWLKNVDKHDPLHVYGSDAVYLKKRVRAEPGLATPLHPELPYTRAEVVWAVREEMARTVEDVLSRRTRALLLDARASIEMAPETARIMAAELDRDDAWIDGQVADYTILAEGYLAS